MNKKKVLIVIDMQNDFVYGPLGTPEAQAIVPNIIKKVEEYRSRDDAIIFTTDTHYDDYLETSEGQKLPVPHCIVGTSGYEIIPELNVELSTMEKIYPKSTFGYRWNTGHWMRCYDVEIIGVCTDICVVTNALVLKTYHPDIEITVDASCCAGSTPEKHKAALEVMKSCQINVIGELGELNK